MRRADVFMSGVPAGILEETEPGRAYRFRYRAEYRGIPVSLTLPLTDAPYDFDGFPPFFDGLLPEGVLLDGLLRHGKLDRNDLFGQLVAVGNDIVGAVTVREIVP